VHTDKCHNIIWTCNIYIFEIDSALAQIENSTYDDNINNSTNDTQKQQVIETQCKSPCPPNAEMCIEMCA
jgi:hypothetical protein